MTQATSNEDLPCLTEVVSDALPDDLPLLTEIIHAPPPAEAIRPVITQPINATPSTRTLNAEEMQQLLLHIEDHLETVFTGKLNSQLEQLQKLAVDLAVSEFKAELPQLLHDALTKSDARR